MQYLEGVHGSVDTTVTEASGFMKSKEREFGGNESTRGGADYTFNTAADQEEFRAVQNAAGTYVSSVWPTFLGTSATH
jgi:hypothetical protein